MNDLGRLIKSYFSKTYKSKDKILELHNKLSNEKVGLKMHSDGKIGHDITFTAFPENFFRIFNNRIIDVDRYWGFDHNPYVTRGEIPSFILDCKEIRKIFNDLYFLGFKELKECKSLIGSSFKILGINEIDIKLRRNRLYKFENCKIIPNLITLHVGNKHNSNKLTPEILNAIKENYSGFKICQVGGEEDQETDIADEDIRGSSIWYICEKIAQSSIFIGINSGMMHIANAYSRVNKRIFCDSMDDFQIHHGFYPYSDKIFNSFWLDYDCRWFNRTERDLGITTSYINI